jgi:hypothetical protein
MNKSDIKLIITLVSVSLITLLCFYIFQKNGDKQALVYYQNELALTIDLSIGERKEYNVSGHNGNVLIISENGKIKVESENSPLNLCSKQGWIESSYETIICLPNKIVIKIDTIEDIDAIVK